ncbi:hypothetical protein FQA39_LY06300 [Lamprigera yunnana]|nr:hypothetical protein FQA39_LY06300 [Lamprigera yunnana]
MNTVFLIGCLCIIFECVAFPMLPEIDYDYEGTNEDSSGSNETSQNLYIIKTVIYEVGLLTEEDNTTDPYDTLEEINLKVYGPKQNKTAFATGSKFSGDLIPGAVSESVILLPLEKLFNKQSTTTPTTAAITTTATDIQETNDGDTTEQTETSTKVETESIQMPTEKIDATFDVK